MPDWLSDMARRAVEKGTLGTSDFDDAEALVLASVGIPDAQRRRASRLTGDMIPVHIAADNATLLSAIREPINVNALHNQAAITFGDVGLTVVWGQNGAGKPGFIRILKRACRSRDQEPILPNVFTSNQTRPAQAKLEWKSTTGANSQVWVDGQSKYDDLSRVVIFDGRCARLFIDDEQEVAIALYGVDVLREMARGCQEIKRRLEVRQAAGRVDPATFEPLRGDTSVGRFVQALSAASKKQTATDLANLFDAEVAELKSLSEQLSDDPARKAVAVRRQIQRYKNFVEELLPYRTILADARVS